MIKRFGLQNRITSHYRTKKVGNTDQRPQKTPLTKQLPGIMLRLLLAWLFALSTINLALDISGLSFRLVPQLLVSASVMVFMLVFFWFWQGLLLLAGVALIAAFYVWLFVPVKPEQVSKLVDSVYGWLQEASRWMTVQQNSFQESELPLLALLVGALISLACFVFVARNLRPWLMLITIAALLSVRQVLGIDTSWLEAAIALLIAFGAFALGQPRWGGKTRPLLITLQPALFKNSLLPVICALLVAGIFSRLVPAEAFTSMRRPYMLEDLVSLFVVPGTGNYETSNYFTISEAGYYPLANRLGGPVSLSGAPVMSVTGTPEDMLVKGSVSDIYDGSSWYRVAMLENHRYDSDLWQEYQSQVFDQDLPKNTPDSYGGNPDATDFPDAWEYSNRLYQIQHISTGIRSVFLTGRPQWILLDAQNSQYVARDFSRGFFFNQERFEESLFFNNGGAIYRMKPFAALQSYTVSSDFYKPEPEYFSFWLTANYPEQVEQTVINPENYSDLNQVDRVYLQLPDLPEYQINGSVYQLTSNLTFGFENQYDKALAIRNYLRGSLRYELNVEIPPEDREFVSWFLEQEEGYCVYFATALTMMCRLAGIPARYVEGYWVPPSSANDPDINQADDNKPEIIDLDNVADVNQRIVTGKQAHAWTEIYLDNFGWIELDATPGGAASAEIFENTGSVEPEPSPPPRPSPGFSEDEETHLTSPSYETNPTEITGPDSPQSDFSVKDLVRIFAILMPVLLTAALILLVTNKLRKLKDRFSETWWRRTYPDIRQRIHHLMPWLYALLGNRKFISGTGETWQNYARRIQLPIKGLVREEEWAAVICTVDEALYSSHQLHKEQWEDLWTAYSDIFIREFTGKPRFISWPLAIIRYWKLLKRN